MIGRDTINEPSAPISGTGMLPQPHKIHLPFGFSRNRCIAGVAGRGDEEA
jgi:hypothetical protein